MGMIVRAVMAYLQSKDFKYDHPEENILITGVGGSNTESIRIGIAFDDGDDKRVHIQTIGLAKVPENKMQAFYPVLNDLNRTFRWTTFIMTESGEVIAEDDAILDIDTAGEEIFEEILRICKIADDAYPQIQKAIWS